MDKKSYCLQTSVLGYWSGLDGFEIHGIENEGMNDYVYAVSGAWGNPRHYGYHKLRVNLGTDRPYVRCYGYRIYLDECVRNRAF